MKPALTVDRLLAGGFTKAGRWRVGQDGRLEIMDVPARSGVYAFAIDGVAQYVGVAANSLAKRIRFYARPGATQKTSIRLNLKIIELCQQGTEIEMLMTFPDDLEWGGFVVKGAEGLEAGIIADFGLPWNIRGAGNRKATAMPLPSKPVIETAFGSSKADSFYVYENWTRDKAIVHRSDCSFCNGGNGLHGSRTTKSSTWHGPFETGGAALAKAKACRKTRTEGCTICSPV